MFEIDDIQFGDIVAIIEYSDGEKLNFSRRKGEVHGHTTLSHTGVTVYGNTTADIAIAVYFEEEGDAFWFAPELVKFLERPPLEMEIGGVKAVRDVDGNWTETTKPWWKFW